MKIWRAFAGLLMTIFIVCAPNTTLAQESVSVNSSILTIDQATLFQSTLYGIRVKQQLETQTQALLLIKRQIEKDLSEEERLLTEQRKTISSEEFRALADIFDEKVQSIRRAQDVKSAELNRILEQEQAQFLNLIIPIIGEIMNENRANIVMNRRDVFISANSIDITDEAVKRIDATIGEGAQPIAPNPSQD